MTDTVKMTTSTPWHLWAVGVVGLLWNGYGGYDYVMTQTNNAAYLAQFTADQRAYFDSFPIWMEVIWAVGVWGAVLGSVLLLLRSKWAFHAFLASLIAFAVSVVYGQMSGGSAVMGTTGVVFSAAIFLLGLGFVTYSRMMTRKGVLR
jgi:nitrate reductase gamma subunit